ncbi:MAG: nitronate monooxygenase [Deltaproteobacteria bacterium]|nr:nitronate monooxygenase [Deltaproteobacteria bacterium]MBW2386060.1 nitronate monooxygenase [Deltaproteobacteria bacterium]MBW2695892.1 nitronate monooxygenase [Deltaproteobacteria bacterium]
MSRPTLRTEFCERVGIEYPIVLAGMGPVAGTGDPVATADLVAAVSNAGGLGVLGGVAYSPDELQAEIRRIRSLTDKPFGVDLLLASTFLIPRPSGVMPKMPSADSFPKEHLAAVRRVAEELDIELKQAPPELEQMGSWVPEGKSWAGAQMEVILEEEVPVFASGLGTPGAFAEALEANGATILSLVGNVRAARQVVHDGAHYVVAQGTEAGGHTGRIGTLALLPQVMDAVAPTPVIAAGGIASGRALAGVLAVGATAAWCGTVFLVSEEANQPDLQKQRILDAAAEETIVTRLYSGKTMRNISNPLIEAWERQQMTALPMGAQTILIRDLTYSIHQAGREELLMNAAGQTAGMLSKKRPAAEILDEMVADAAEILASGLGKRIKAAV